jgi:hypothetical protein
LARDIKQSGTVFKNPSIFQHSAEGKHGLSDHMQVLKCGTGLAFAMYNHGMQPKKILLVVTLAGMLSACRLVNWEESFTSTPTATSTPARLHVPTITETPSPPVTTYLPMCTPPLCAIGTSEVYYCSETCPNGCGTTCATYTPTPTPP